LHEKRERLSFDDQNRSQAEQHRHSDYRFVELAPRSAVAPNQHFSGKPWTAHA
jgi:hypothetical protein